MNEHLTVIWCQTFIHWCMRKQFFLRC